MEQSLLGNKQIRQYFKCFSENHWNRVAKATMLMGIQQLMHNDPLCLQGNYSHLSVEHLEDFVGKFRQIQISVEHESMLVLKKIRGPQAQQKAQSNPSTPPAPEAESSAQDEQPPQRHVQVVEDSGVVNLTN